MRIYDLSHTLATGSPVYPGDSEPVITRVASYHVNGFEGRRLDMSSHAGTHVDVPAHMMAEGDSLNTLGVESFVGAAAVVDVACDSPGLINADDFTIPENVDFVLFRTGWDRYWGTNEYFRAFPALSSAAAKQLAAAGLKGIGLDSPSVDPVDSEDYIAHFTILGAGMVIIENLTGLGQLPDGPFTFSALPLKIADGDGSPVRAVGICT